MTINDLERRVSDLEDGTGGGGGTGITINYHRVDQQGDWERFEEIHCWEDDRGEWHSETTKYDVDGVPP